MIDTKKIINTKIYELTIGKLINMIYRSGVDIKKVDEELYSELISYLKIYIKKVPTNVQKVITKYIDIDNVKIYIVDKKPINNFAFVEFSPFSKEMSISIILEFEFDEKTSEDKIKNIFTMNIRDIVYSLYQESIRYALITKFSKLKVDDEILVLSSHVLTSALIKIFGKKYAPSLEDKAIKMIVMAVSYMILTYYLKFDPRSSLTHIKEIYSKKQQFADVVDEFVQEMQKLKLSSYTNIQYLGTLLDDLNLLKLPGSKFMTLFVFELGTKFVMDLLLSYPSLICNEIIVKYPVSYASKKLYVSGLNEKLEEYVIKNYV